MNSLNLKQLPATPTGTKAELRAYFQQWGTVVDRNSKINASCYNVDPLNCETGAKLRNIKDSVCSGCYAMKAYNQYPSVRTSQGGNRDKWLEGDITGWIESMVWQIEEISARKAAKGKQGAYHHRWFAAGDVVDVMMTHAILEVAKRTPNIKHWFVTREVVMVRNVATPDNLVIRVSSSMIDGAPRTNFEHTCTVHRDAEPVGMVCPAMANGGECGDCTSCWNKDIANISYKFH